MELKNKTILLISPESWDHIFVSKHHYAIHLAARGNKVFFLNPPQNKISICPTDFNNVWSVNYTNFVKGIRFYPAFIQKWLLRTKFNQLQQLCNVKFDIVWSFDNSVFYNFNALPKSILKISHIVDLNQNFQTKIAASTANICFAVSNNILDRLQKFQKKSFWVNHGLNKTPIHTQVNILPGMNKFKVALIGNLAMPYLDWKILYDTVKSNQESDFIFYGPNANNFSFKINDFHIFKKKIGALKNSYFPGKVDANIIPSILERFDILLVSYKEVYHKDQSNSHKMMEYLGSGKVVVATKTLEYENLANTGLIAMTDKNEDFPLLFKNVLNNLKEWNSEEKTKNRIEFASDNTYDKQIDRIEEILNSTL